MATTTTAQDPSGRTLVKIHDDSGAPFSFVSNAINLIGQGSMQEVIQIPLTRDDTLQKPRPNLTHGQIFISAQASFIVLDYVTADIEVRGYVGAIYSVIGRAQLGGDRAVMRVTFDSEDCFERIAIAARESVDGNPDVQGLPDVLVLQLSAIAYMWGA